MTKAMSACTMQGASICLKVLEAQILHSMSVGKCNWSRMRERACRRGTHREEARRWSSIQSSPTRTAPLTSGSSRMSLTNFPFSALQTKIMWSMHVTRTVAPINRSCSRSWARSCPVIITVCLRVSISWLDDSVRHALRRAHFRSGMQRSRVIAVRVLRAT